MSQQASKPALAVDVPDGEEEAAQGGGACDEAAAPHEGQVGAELGRHHDQVDGRPAARVAAQVAPAAAHQREAVQQLPVAVRVGRGQAQDARQQLRGQRLHGGAAMPAPTWNAAATVTAGCVALMRSARTLNSKGPGLLLTEPR